jgi:hypothetical protein
VARQFNQKPVVGICLKRYMMTETGLPKRHDTYIDIPDSLRLPHFMLMDDARIKESNELSTEYKLVLQSVICHRGDSLHSGHYVTFARVNPKLLTDNRRHDFDPPPDYEEAQWVKFDDLLLDSRVSYVDDLKQALKDEMPYLLFYQILPMVDVTRTSTEGDTEPPSYNDSTVNVPGIVTPNPDSDQTEVSRQPSSYFDTAAMTNSTGPSIRFSADLERPPRISLDEESNSSGPQHKNGTSRRVSLTFSEAAANNTGPVTPEGHSPAVTPNEETTTQRLTRAAARFTKNAGSRSRPASQTGENRISTTMSRLGLVRQSKEPLREDEDGGDDGADAAVGPEPTPTADTHLQPKKDKSKTKTKGEKDTEKGKDKDKTTKVKTGVPERECVVM